MNKVFIESNYVLENITDFAQFVLNGKKLITLCGEVHNSNFICKDGKKNININEYIRLVSSQKIKTKILIEKHPYEETQNVGSHNMNLLNENIPNVEKVFFDHRHYYIGKEFNNILYNDDSRFFALSQDDIYFKYVDPFYKNVENLVKLKDEKQYTIESVYFFYNKYIPCFVETRFKNIFNKITRWNYMNQQEKVEYRTEIRDAWMYLSDFYVFRELLQNDGTEQYIILSGRSHYLSLCDTMDIIMDFSKIKQDHMKYKAPFRSTDKVDCISVFETYKMK